LEDIVCGDNCFDDDVVPNNFSEAAVKGDIRPAGIFEAQGKFVGLSIIVVAVAGRTGWENDDWGFRTNWDIVWGRHLRRKSGRSVLRRSDYWDDWGWWGDSGGCDYAGSIEGWYIDAGGVDGWDAD
jgi:hypothetical protein